MLGLFRKKEFFTQEEKLHMVEAIRHAERRTSGEIRLFVESHCRFVDPVDRAAEIFFGLEMDETDQHNAVLVYVAVKDHQLAVFGDRGIHEKVGADYWNNEVKLLLNNFNRENYVSGICQCINDIGEALQEHFPFARETDKNELPDDIVFGK